MLARLLELLKTRSRVVIQPHNFPDHDAIASAYGLQHLFALEGVTAEIVYAGDIQRDSLRKMMEELAIRATPHSEAGLQDNDAIVVVDGCKGNQNVTDLVGEEVGVIDHHEVTAPEDVPFADIRSELGSCSTLIYRYYRDLDHPIPRSVATALLVGLNMDTALMTRGVSPADVDAYAHLYTCADVPMHNSILRNFVQLKDLDFYRYALERTRIDEPLAFCYFAEGCDQNMLGILADFFLALREVRFVVMCARNNDVVNFSVRSEEGYWNASAILQQVLEGIGFGGGHKDMAGGLVRDLTRFEPELIRRRFLTLTAG